MVAAAALVRVPVHDALAAPEATLAAVHVAFAVVLDSVDGDLQHTFVVVDLAHEPGQPLAAVPLLDDRESVAPVVELLQVTDDFHQVAACAHVVVGVEHCVGV